MYKKILIAILTIVSIFSFAHSFALSIANKNIYTVSYTISDSWGVKREGTISAGTVYDWIQSYPSEVTVNIRGLSSILGETITVHDHCYLVVRDGGFLKGIILEPWPGCQG